MKYVYSFHEGNKDMKEILGGKGANLAEMTLLGLPVPQGFTISTDACLSYYENEGKIKSEIVTAILEKIKELENLTKKQFGKGPNPLLVSIRSGARVSMPGMMDTILNLGMNDEVAESLIAKTNDKRFVYDSYRRFIQMFADVVKGYPKKVFEDQIAEIKQRRQVTRDLDLTAEDMQELTIRFKQIYQTISKTEFPSNPERQLLEAVSAVFRSWNTKRAIYYRKMNDIPNDWGTAVNVQEMVYGNFGTNSGTGVAFTRNPSNGANELFGEYLMNAQGEDVVAGIRTPNPISELQTKMPSIYQEFYKNAMILEHHYRDMQDMEFTIENGTLYMLQTRSGKRTTAAALKIAVDMQNEGLITKEEAIMRIESKELDQILHSVFDENELKHAEKIAEGLAASPGAATGYLCFHAKDALNRPADKTNCILVRTETSPEDIEGMNHAEGILTVRGGMTSHAAVVARGMGKCCICGCDSIVIDEEKKTLTLKDGRVLTENDIISIDGTTGFVYYGQIEYSNFPKSPEYTKFMQWVDETRKLKVRANADSKEEAETAKSLGAEGIGLCRTEHMFFEPSRIFNFRKMILATNKEERVVALNALLVEQRKDFEELFRAMAPLPVVIRYLDPPLHEFLPKTEEEINLLAHSLDKTPTEIKNRIIALKEFNPMMGHRGCRLDITYPEIAQMQTRAIIEAGINVMKSGLKVKPEIMVPLTGDKKEFDYVKKIIDETALQIMKEQNCSIEYEVGTMIEIPRACVLADEIAKSAAFFSFGTNDLTQLTYGFSRDDASKFLKDYYEKGIMNFDPFETIDQKGVGSLMNVAIEISKKVRPDISLGICGEHAADAKSVEFCHQIGLDYVSCSPYRIPIARLAAAQASIKANQSK